MNNHPVLRRDSARRILGGVCAGLARTWNVDPLLVRAALIVATVVTSGLAFFLYLALWLAVPSDRTVRPSRTRSPRSILAVLAILLAALVIAVPESRFAGVGIALLGVVALAWFALSRGGHPHAGRPGSLSAPHPGTMPPASEPYGAPEWKQPPTARHHETLGAWSYDQPPARRPRVWRRVVLATLASWLVLGIADAVGVQVRGVAYPAAALAVIGLALIAASRPERAAFGRPRGLVSVGLVAALVTMSMLIPATGTPASAQGYRAITDASELPSQIQVGMGTHTVDLSGLSLDEDRTVTVVQDAGSLTLILPASAAVSARYEVDMGRVETPQHRVQGMDLSVSESYAVAPGEPVLTVLVELDMGNVEVHR